MSGAGPLRLTVGIATWNRARLLEETLESLVRLDVPPHVTLEVLVCDNNSTDNTREVIGAFSDLLPIRSFVERRLGKAFALSALLREAEGEWVLFLDDDVLVESQWLAAYVEGIRRYPSASCLGGQVRARSAAPARGIPRLLHREYPWVYGILEFDSDDTISPGDLRFAYGANLAVRRDLVHLPNDIDERRGLFGRLRVSGEDFHLVSTILSRGGEGRRLAGAVVHHFIPPERAGLRRFVAFTLGSARNIALRRGLAITGSVRYRSFAARWVALELARAAVRVGRVWLRDRSSRGDSGGRVTS